VTGPSILRAALDTHEPGRALPRVFAIDPSIYDHEQQAIWRSSWLFAGCSAEARDPGDFFRYEIGDNSIVVVRDEHRVLHALHNTCRHRGMPICAEAQGNARRWTCPYHQWSYALDGRLLGAGGMDTALDVNAYGLHHAAVAEIRGLIFVWLGPDPEGISNAASELEAALAPQGLDHAQVAQTIHYDVHANWKLIWENNRECWHCTTGHPQYVKANFDTAPDTTSVRELAASRATTHQQLLRAIGAPTIDEHIEPGLYRFPDPERWWSANRTPCAPGFVTESIDGQPVAPLMGEYADYDVGTLRVRAVPNFWGHASADHAVLTRLSPVGPERTAVRVQWLVDADAKEGRDYHLERLLPFWQLTSEQDWDLCERNHAGVRNPAFTPGPYSLKREYNVLAFVSWYTRRVSALLT